MRHPDAGFAEPYSGYRVEPEWWRFAACAHALLALVETPTELIH
jgi:hypothetical protein